MPDETMFEVGDRVRYVKDITAKPTLIGERGTCIEIDDNGTAIAVEFDNDINGHSCHSRARPFHGWWCHPSELEAIVEEPAEVQINFSFDDFLNGVEDY